MLVIPDLDSIAIPFSHSCRLQYFDMCVEALKANSENPMVFCLVSTAGALMSEWLWLEND